MRYAGFWVRAGAHLVDTFFVSGSSFAFDWVGGKFFNDDSLTFQAVSGGFALGVAVGYYVYGTYRYGTTPGKRIWRIAVVQYPAGGPIRLGQAWRRFAGYAISYLPYATGFLMVLFHPEKRGLHDLIGRTVSVRLEKGQPYPTRSPGK